MSINVIITFQSKPEKKSDFLQILNQIKVDLPKVDGCKTVQIFNDTSEPCVFTLVETWHSENQHKNHIDSVIASGAWDHIASHLACGPASSYYVEV